MGKRGGYLWWGQFKSTKAMMINTSTTPITNQLGGGEQLNNNTRSNGGGGSNHTTTILARTTPINNQLGRGESNYTTILAITRRRMVQLSRGVRGWDGHRQPQQREGGPVQPVGIVICHH
jgi:hypothetical protein